MYYYKSDIEDKWSRRTWEVTYYGLQFNHIESSNGDKDIVTPEFFEENFVNESYYTEEQLDNIFS